MDYGSALNSYCCHRLYKTWIDSQIINCRFSIVSSFVVVATNNNKF